VETLGAALDAKGPLVWFPPIYKFMDRKYVRGFLKHGRIRIGTSQEYRLPDGKDGGRSDSEELVSVWMPPAGIEICEPSWDTISIGTTVPTKVTPPNSTSPPALK
jgi:hypothetical protein